MKKVVLHHAALAEPVEVAWQRTAGDSRDGFAVRLGDESIDLAITRMGAHGGVLRCNDRVAAFHAVRHENRVQVWIDGRTYDIEIVGRQERRSAANCGVLGDLVAPMPGTVLAVRVATGDEFKAHDPLVVLESMKMEMTLSAPAAGKVDEVLCRDGELVEMGAPLLKLSGAEDADVS